MSEELKNISPKLSEFQKHNIGFKTTENYFNEMEDRILNQIKLTSNIQKNGFIIPENYFENIENEINLKVIKQNNFKVPSDYFKNFEVKLEKSNINSESKVFTLNRFWIPAAIAAMFLIAFSINSLQSKKSDIQMADMEKWIENGAIDVNSYELGAIYETELENINLTDFVAQEEIEDYLGNDINEIIYYD